MTQPQGDTDFFISYRGARTDWARWVNWVVRSEGYSTVLMDEFPVGTTWTSQMRNAAQKCRRLIPLYSADYWASGACVEEFDAYWQHHLQNGAARFLLPLEIQNCTVPQMHGMLLWKPLHALTRDAARAAILKVLEGIAPVSTAAAAYTDPEPPFPGIASAPATLIDWPDSVDSLKWPLANHDNARLAFAELVTRSAKFRLLAIKGSSETGKSHLTEQFFNNARRRVTVCRCARFDFKGTDQIDQTLATFVQHLGVPLPPPAISLSDRFRPILQSLAQRQQPCLLIFDTYEDAGDAERWICDSLLASLHLYQWLRVVIAGQNVPPCHGKLWDEEAMVLNLAQPEPVHWHTYAQTNGRAMSLRFIQEAHKHTNGKASILAQLCGPQHT
jgi:hypothetical protein